MPFRSRKCTVKSVIGAYRHEWMLYASTGVGTALDESGVAVMPVTHGQGEVIGYHERLSTCKPEQAMKLSQML